MIYEYWFATIQGLPDRLKFAIREFYGSGKRIYEDFEDAFLIEEKRSKVLIDTMTRARKLPLQKLLDRYHQCLEEGITFLPWFHEDYPIRLRMLADPPYALYLKGRLPEENVPAVAIVVARTCSAYGEEMALYCGKVWAECGFQVISGMARGIDGAGQRGALNGGGKTFAVLGSGPDICYPREHIGLYTDIQKNGGILSEYMPGTQSLARHFPERNRIISGLSDLILVMEAKEKSGSLITADCALEQGKEVFALPGPVTSPLSQGCHQLIRQGAGILISPEKLLEDLGIKTNISVINKKSLEREDNLLYSFLDFVPKSLDQIVKESKIPPNEVIEGLISLELDGKIREVSKNHYVRCGLKPA
ncbi:MAG: DNA-processing protein DprA [Dorea sp.]|nr:DNA-processing protein DprA [Dorea sp.]